MAGPVETVRVVRTADFVSAIGGQHARLMKLDVEGHESAVLAGAAEFLTRAGPDVILFEEHRVPALDQPSVQLVRAARHRAFAIPRAKLRLRLRPIEHSAQMLTTLSQSRLAGAATTCRGGSR